MIKTLTVQNFQSHEDTQVEFHPGVNVFVGKTDQGKTVMMRAITWVAFNRPRGADFRSHWGGDTGVEIEVAEGDIVSRLRTKSKNLYYLNGEQLASFGANVPDEVQKVLLLGDVNLQEQHDPPFMISDTSTGVARRLNAVADLEDIDVIMSKVNSFKLSVQSNVRNLEDVIEETQAQMNELPDTKAHEKEAEAIRVLVAEHDTANKTRTQIDGAVRLDASIRDRLSRMPDTHRADPKLDKLNRAHEQIRDWSALSYKLLSSARDLATTEDRIEALPDVDKVDLSEVTELHQKIEALGRDCVRIRKTVTEVERCTERIESEERLLIRLVVDLTEATPDICPTCGQEIPK